MFIFICLFVYFFSLSGSITNWWAFTFLYLQLPKGREVEDDDSFVFNEGFTAPLYRIKVN